MCLFFTLIISPFQKLRIPGLNVHDFWDHLVSLRFLPKLSGSTLLHINANVDIFDFVVKYYCN